MLLEVSLWQGCSQSFNHVKFTTIISCLSKAQNKFVHQVNMKIMLLSWATGSISRGSMSAFDSKECNIIVQWLPFDLNEECHWSTSPVWISCYYLPLFQSNNLLHLLCLIFSSTLFELTQAVQIIDQ